MKAKFLRKMWIPAVLLTLFGALAFLSLTNPKSSPPFLPLANATVVGSSTSIFKDTGSVMGRDFITAKPSGFWKTGSQPAPTFHFITMISPKGDFISKSTTYRVHKPLAQIKAELQALEKKSKTSPGVLIAITSPTGEQNLALTLPSGQRVQVNLKTEADKSYTLVTVFEDREMNLWDKAEALFHMAYNNKPPRSTALILNAGTGVGFYSTSGTRTPVFIHRKLKP